MRRLAALSAVLLLATGPAGAVGLGPLSKEGVTDGPDKAFYLTLYNPYAERAAFSVHAVGWDDETPASRVRTPPPMPLRAQSQRRFLIVASGLAPGETYRFRLCAERVTSGEEPVHARVCSRVTARRLSAG